MFRKITVAYNGSTEAARTAKAIQLVKALSAELRVVTVRQDLFAYAAYAAAAGSSLSLSHSRELIEDQQAHLPVCIPGSGT